MNKMQELQTKLKVAKLDFTRFTKLKNKEKRKEASERIEELQNQIDQLNNQ